MEAFDPKEMTLGEAAAFAAGYTLAKAQAEALIASRQEGLDGLCCDSALALVADDVRMMEAEDA